MVAPTCALPMQAVVKRQMARPGVRPGGDESAAAVEARVLSALDAAGGGEGPVDARDMQRGVLGAGVGVSLRAALSAADEARLQLVRAVAVCIRLCGGRVSHVHARTRSCARRRRRRRRGATRRPHLRRARPPGRRAPSLRGSVAAGWSAASRSHRGGRR